MILRPEVEKSLFDKKIESFVYNPKLVVNRKSKSIKDRIVNLLRSSDRVDIAVSYSVWSGLQLIFDELKKFDSDSRIILTTEGYVTDPTSLRKLSELQLEVKIYSPEDKGRGFHLKTYMFEKENDRTLIIGSANISARAFGLVHEMVVEIEAKKDGQIVDEYTDVFNDLWNDEYSANLDDKFIDEYEVKYKEQRSLIKKAEQYSGKISKIKANFMQIKALESIKEARDDGKGLVIAATGTGKTYLSAFDVEEAKAKKVLFLVHNRLILTSAIETFGRVFDTEDILELSSVNKDQLDSNKYIFTTDKTANSLLVNEVSTDYFDYIIYDEAHKIGDKTLYSTIIDYFKPKYTLGITATPERTTDSEYLFKVFEYHVPYEIRLLDAMNKELVCPFTYFGVDVPGKLLDSKERFKTNELAKYMKKLIDTKGHYGDKLRGIVFCRDKSEAIDVNTALNEIGYNSLVAISGKQGMKREEIEEGIRSLSSNDENSVNLICVVNKFNEGIDIPEINTIFMLRNTTSSIIYTQQLGRGLRKTNDEHKFVTVFDLIGNSKNDYSIAQVLTGNKTADKRELFKQANDGFNSVSPFINVDIEKEAMDKIIRSISNNFKVKSQLRIKIETELHRYKEIPTLLDMYRNHYERFSELDLLQLLYKDFYTPFNKYYVAKYEIEKNSLFLKNFFRLITQFVLRGYDSELLKDYIDILDGRTIENDLLKRILCYGDVENGISTSINSTYYKKGNDFPDVFVLSGDSIKLNRNIRSELEKRNANDLFVEHIELFKEVHSNRDYIMKPFDLIDKAEFLFHTGSNNCYLNAVGEYVDKVQKKVYCPITISKVTKNYSNKIFGKNHLDRYLEYRNSDTPISISSDLLVYCTQKQQSIEKSIAKDNMIIDENYDFYVCAKFPHLGYETTTYINLGDLEYLEKSEPIEHPEGGYYHEITFKIVNALPKELLQYEDE